MSLIIGLIRFLTSFRMTFYDQFFILSLRTNSKFIISLFQSETALVYQNQSAKFESLVER